MKEYNERQGGWIVGFVVVGGLLLLGLMTGLYYFKTSVNQAKGPETTELAKNDQPSDESNNQSASSDKATGDTNEDNTKSNSPSSPAETDDTAADDDDTSSNVLPQTGPTNTLLNAVFAALFVFALATYLRSRADVRVTL